MKTILLLFLTSVFSGTVTGQERTVTDTPRVEIPELPLIPEEAREGIADAPDLQAKTPTGSPSNSMLSALLSYNFSGGNKALSNLTPIVEYGWSHVWEKTGYSLVLAIHPYVAGQIDTRDQENYIPGLMLPGVAGIKTDVGFLVPCGDFTFMLSPANFGYKLASGFSEEDLVIAQHNYRASVGVRFADYFILSMQYTHGWHNSTSESEKTFQTLFGNNVTDIQYLNVTLQTKVTNLGGSAPTFLFAEWRGLLNGDRFDGFENSKIMTFGIRSTMDFSHSNPAAIGKRLF